MAHWERVGQEEAERMGLSCEKVVGDIRGEEPLHVR
jgi:hypothetical protein